jgi:hypothetical protein
LLKDFEVEEIVAFQEHLDERMWESYRYDLWAVAFIMNGGCSDDGFDYFRGWLIAQGRDVFEGAMRAPERAADAVHCGTESDPASRWCESLLYSAQDAYEAKVGTEMPPRQPPPFVPIEPTGVPWDEDDLDHLYPELATRFAY